MADQGRNEVFAIVRQLDPKLPSTSKSFMVASILLAALRVGADEDAIASMLGYAPEFVCDIGAKLRRGRIWDGLQSPQQADWMDEAGGVSFWMDALVGEGTMICVVEDGERMYSLSYEGRRSAERALDKR